MSYYKDLENSIHWLDNSDGEYLLPDGFVKITDDEASLISNPPITAAEERSFLERKSYEIAGQLLDAATLGYTAAEMNQWPNMVAQAESANWTYFDTMTPLGITGQEYGEYVLVKHTALKGIFDLVINARNNHKIAIAGTPDVELKYYDINLFWPEV